jgi:mannose-6-phosphate isomerase-like protein (cupin superfamily)
MQELDKSRNRNAQDLLSAFLAVMCDYLRVQQFPDECRDALDTMLNSKSGRLRFGSQSLPVCRYWTPSLAAVSTESTSALAQALRDLTPTLRWTQNPNYTPGDVGKRFLENYGYAELIGNDGLFESDTLAIGVLLLGPETHYPEHSHPAKEDYFVVSGNARWLLDGDTVMDTKSGGHVPIASGVRHATTTCAEPLVMIYVWSGDVNVRARLT